MVAPARSTLLTRRDDALGRRVIEREYDTTTEKLTHQDTILYTRHWQRLETRRQLPLGGTNNPLGTAQLYRQHVWHASAIAYVDQCCEQQTDTTGDGVLDQTLYFLQDAMYNVAAAIDDTGAVDYRLACSLYGQVETLDADYTPTPGPAGNLLAQQGLFLTAADLYDNRHRVRDPRLGRFLQEDPLGYPDGSSLYTNWPILLGLFDPKGLACWIHWGCHLVAEVYDPDDKERNCEYLCYEYDRADRLGGACGCGEVPGKNGSLKRRHILRRTGGSFSRCPDCPTYYEVKYPYDCTPDKNVMSRVDYSDCIKAYESRENAAEVLCAALKGLYRRLCLAAVDLSEDSCKTYCEVFQHDIIENGA